MIFSKENWFYNWFSFCLRKNCISCNERKRILIKLYY
uniref:Uncharacterized protein n=1 Tax=Siphoviridae sp. ctWT735 TaxID=2825538 RepID=A0A8S5TU95_9CAUD|nr:MAG TPA: hypothetical protein [Siphoviridae sp. ctWT735]